MIKPRSAPGAGCACKARISISSRRATRRILKALASRDARSCHLVDGEKSVGELVGPSACQPTLRNSSRGCDWAIWFAPAAIEIGLLLIADADIGAVLAVLYGKFCAARSGSEQKAGSLFFLPREARKEIVITETIR